MSEERERTLRELLRSPESWDAIAADLLKAEARCAHLHKALEPFSRFYAAWIAAPLGGHDDVLYAIHTGTQFAAALRLSDMKSAHDAVLAQEGKCPSVERMEERG